MFTVCFPAMLSRFSKVGNIRNYIFRKPQRFLLKFIRTWNVFWKHEFRKNYRKSKKCTETENYQVPFKCLEL